jgi:hypothetical protein
MQHMLLMISSETPGGETLRAQPAARPRQATRPRLPRDLVKPVSTVGACTHSCGTSCHPAAPGATAECAIHRCSR